VKQRRRRLPDSHGTPQANLKYGRNNIVIAQASKIQSELTILISITGHGYGESMTGSFTRLNYIHIQI
jgi:hypothetical protein